MKIEFANESSFFSEDSIILRNAVVITNNDIKYYYEFNIVTFHEALVSYNSILYINEAIEYYNKHNKNIDIYYNKDRSFYRAFDRVQSFKLPIKCLQPAEFFLDNDYLEMVDKYMNYDFVCVPVCIINEEYVLLDKSELIYLMNSNYEKLVSVYIDDYNERLHDIIYVLKENNITSVDKINVVGHEEYVELMNNIREVFNN